MPRGLFWVSEPDEEIAIRRGTEGCTSAEPITVMEALKNRVGMSANTAAYRVKRNGEWVEQTWQQFSDAVHAAAKAMIYLGVQRYDGVCILGFNSPEWVTADLAAIFAGGLATGIYTTSSPEMCQYIAAHCNASLFFVENELQLAKIQAIRAKLPNLKAIVQWSGTIPAGARGVISWAEFMRAGNTVSDALLRDRIRRQRPGHCCTLIYTSGTTGPPKAVMLSHDNVTFTATMDLFHDGLPSRNRPDRTVSFLPLSHIAAQNCDIYIPMLLGCTVSFAQPDALQGTLGETLKEVRPTTFFAVPRVWEKMMETIKGAMAAMGSAGSSAPPPKGFIAAALGLDQAEWLSTGAAPITMETLRFFEACGLTIHSVYGMSECTGPQTNCWKEGNKFGTVGKPHDGSVMKIDRPDADGNGEICYAGRHIMMGYMKDPTSSAATIDSQGFLKSGDIGNVDRDGFLTITGRIKELIITAGGENVPPVLIESVLLKEIPILSNAMVVGDKRKYLTALLAVKTVIDVRTGAPTDALTPDAQATLAKIGVQTDSMKAAVKDPKVVGFVQAGIDRYNKTSAVSSAQQIRKWTFLPTDFSLPGGELTPTMKLKRAVVSKKYADLIETLYAEVPTTATGQIKSRL